MVGVRQLESKYGVEDWKNCTGNCKPGQAEQTDIPVGQWVEGMPGFELGAHSYAPRHVAAPDAARLDLLLEGWNMQLEMEDLGSKTKFEVVFNSIESYCVHTIRPFRPNTLSLSKTKYPRYLKQSKGNRIKKQSKETK